MSVTGGGGTVAGGAAGAPLLIDVGAANSDGTLRRWLAQQAVAKGEAILGAQQPGNGNSWCATRIGDPAQHECDVDPRMGRDDFARHDSWNFVGPDAVCGVGNRDPRHGRVVRPSAVASHSGTRFHSDSRHMLCNCAVARLLASTRACTGPGARRAVRHGTRGARSAGNRLRGCDESQHPEAQPVGTLAACRVAVLCRGTAHRGGRLYRANLRAYRVDRRDACLGPCLSRRRGRLLHWHGWHRDRSRPGRCGLRRHTMRSF